MMKKGPVLGVSYRSKHNEEFIMTDVSFSEQSTGELDSVKQRKLGNISSDIHSLTSSSSTISDYLVPTLQNKAKNPSLGVTYAWKNLDVYAVKKSIFSRKSTEFHILKDVSSVCKPGQLLAIMGASGAGKTTLLNILTYRASKMRITGSITINGRPADPVTVAGASAYVQQLDLFTGVFTVREQLNFCAQLRIGKGVPAEERKQRVEQCLKELGLSKCSDTLIGVPGRVKGISGGEKKRLAFACELITNPMMLLCDEPTSGLDSFMAQNVMAAMKKMADEGRTVISTIHQPSSEVFAMFDQLLILAEGRVAFMGNVRQAHAFFERLHKPCPETFNPGDHFIHTLAVRAGKEEQCRAYIHSVCDNFRDNEGIAVMEDVEKCSQLNNSGQNDGVLEQLAILSKDPYRSTWTDQFLALMRRSSFEIIRDPIVTVIKLVTSIFFALIFGLIYFDLDPLTQVRDINAALFVFVTNMTFSNMFPVITVFSATMPLFLREHWNGLYRTDVYFITRMLVELPIYSMLPMLFVSVNYFMVDFRPGAEFFFAQMGVQILVANVAVSYGYMISCMAKDYNNALVLSTPLLFPLFLFGGFYVQSGTIPVYLDWISYLSWFKYAYECLVINQWDDFYPCSHVNSSSILDDVIFKDDNIAYDQSYDDTMSSPLNSTCINGNYILHILEVDPTVFYVNIGALFALLIGFRILAFLLLLQKTLRKK